MRPLALVVVIVVGAVPATGCRVDCESAGDCGRGELCGDEGRCQRLPEAAPIGAVVPGPSMEALAVYPAPGARAVPARAPVVVLTTRTVAPESVTETSFAMEDTRGLAVAGAFDWLVDPPGFLYVPAEPLASGASYNVRVTTGVRDGSGNALRLPIAWTFTVDGS